MKKPIFAIDFGTVFGVDQRLINRVKTVVSGLDPDYKKLKREQHYHYDFALNYPQNFREQINIIKESPDFFWNLEPILGVKEAIDLLIKLNFNVLIVSLPILGQNSEGVEHEKASLMFKHFMCEKMQISFVSVLDKTALECDYLIDSNPDIEGSCKPKFNYLVYDEGYNYNLHIPSERKINWQVFEPRLKAILKHR
ncbi:MAG: hypothetical protein NTZ44_00495 [Candidatus Nomurabacteria bacterium]|nr:hypothetical protein [Candidatus Nomurabacteria bacterium]